MIRLTRLVASTICFLMSSLVSASNIAVSNVDADVVRYIESSASVDSSDLLVIRRANSSGISINRLDRLVVDKPLKIVNLPGNTSVDEGYDPARLIVLVVNNPVSLASSVTVVGPASDLLLLTNRPGSAISNPVGSENSIECIGCEILNVYRATLASARATGPLASFLGGSGNYDDVNQITNLVSYDPRFSNTHNDFSFISISGLRSPGAMSVELLAERVILDGLITTHSNVSKSYNGGYISDPSGDTITGGGQLQVIVGSASFNYETFEANGFLDDALVSTGPGLLQENGSQVTATSIIVHANRNIRMLGALNTKTDLLATVRYNNYIQTAEERITISGFSENSFVSVAGKLESSGAVELKSAGDLFLPAGEVMAPNVSLIAGGNLANKAEIESDTFSAAAANILNQNKILAFKSSELWSNKNISNEYGGVIASNFVKLQADHGIIRNGARCGAVYSNQSSVQYDESCEQMLDLSHKMTNPQSNMIDYGVASASWGTTENKEFLGDKPQNTYAHIIGNNIYLKSAALENINPYWKHEDENGAIYFDRQYVNQVSISAEDGLFINNTEYTLNSSAILRVNKESGMFQVTTSLLSNERFKVVTLLDYEKLQTTTTETTNTSTIQSSLDIEGYFFDVFTKSPPGVIHSMGQFQLIGDSFLNNTSYFEVFSDAWFATKNINSIGIELTSKERGKASQLEILNECDAIICIVNNVTSTINRNSSERYLTPEQLDSLFYIRGDAVGINDSLYVGNLRPFDTYLSMTEEDIKSELYAKANAWVEAQKKKYPKENWRTFEYSVNSSDVHSVKSTYRYFETCSVRVGGCTGSRVSTTHSISLWDRFNQLLQSAISYMRDIWNNIALDWWN